MKSPRPLLVFFTLVVTASAKPPDGLQNKLSSVAKTQPGGIAIAWVDREGTAFFFEGKFSADDARPITADTQFEIGSVTKGFTALLLAESERQGRVSRHDAAARYLLPADDAAQPSLAKVTLLSLVTHSAGLPRLPFNIAPNPDRNPDPYATYDRAALIEALRHHGPVAPVGQSTAYSNLGSALLGEALAAAWGMSYADALERHVLTPLGMNDTTLALTETPAPAELAPGHANGSKTGNWQFLAFAPAGALRSSARDLAAFLQAALGGDDAPLNAALSVAFQPQRTFDATGGEIGLGWFLNGDKERLIIWHNGATAGYRSFIGFSRESGAGVAVLANSGANVDGLGFALLGTPPPRPALGTVKDAEAFIGSYSLTPAFAIDITTRNGALFAQATGQPRLALRESSADRFAIVGAPAQISFERDADGKVAALVLHQNGLDQRAPRAELPPPPHEIALSTETLAEYVGNYPFTPTFSLSITVEGASIFAQASGQPKFEIFATARDEFILKVVEARISFTRDSTGKIDGLILHQNNRATPAKKTE